MISLICSLASSSAQDIGMATDVASIVVPRADDSAGQQHTPTGAHTPLSPSLLSPMLSPKLPKPTDPEELAAAIRKQVRVCMPAAQSAGQAADLLPGSRVGGLGS